jgi:hypothetical protein
LSDSASSTEAEASMARQRAWESLFFCAVSMATASIMEPPVAFVLGLMFWPANVVITLRVMNFGIVRFVFDPSTN